MRRVILLILLLLVPLASTQAQTSPAAPGDLDLKDREGDVSVRQGPRESPGTPASANVDILSLRLHSEDAEGLWLDLYVKQLREPADVSQPAARGYSIFFGLEKPGLSYRADFRQYGGISNATPAFLGEFCAGPKGGYCQSQRASGAADYANNALRIFIPKLSLMGRNALGESYSSQAMPDVALKPGDRLVDFRAEAYGGYVLGDRVPDTGTGGPYVLKHAAANDRLRLSLAGANETEERQSPSYQPDDDGAFPLVAVEAGAATPVKVQVENLNGGKRVVNLSATFADPKAREKWSIRMAPSVAVPGNESRTVNLVVSAAVAVQHREETLVRIQARSENVEGELGALTLRLVASAPPSPTKNTLYLHAAREQDHFFGPSCQLPRSMPFMCTVQYWMNTLKDDPRGTSDKDGISSTTPNWNTGGWNYNFGFRLDAPLSNDLVLDAKTPVEASIRVASAAADGTVRVRLSAGAIFVGEGTQDFKAQGSEAAQITFLPTIDATRIPSGSTLSFTVTIAMPASSPQAAATPPTLSLKESALKLPAIADANATQDVAPSLGDAFLSLSVKGDREEFVNPSEARAFQFTILNEGSIEDVVTLAATSDGGCRTEFKPGSKYRLDAGDSARFGLLVHAPVDAKEGLQCRVRVNATSNVDPATVAARDVLVTVTRGVDTPNDAENYTANEDAASKLDQERPSKKSPGVAVLGIVAGVFAVAYVRRRSQA